MISILQIEQVWKQNAGDTAIVMTKNSPYKKFIDEAILKMFESGKLRNILQRWKVEEPDCSPMNREGKPLNFKKLISIFVIIGLGVLFAIIVVLLENFQVNYLRKKNDPNNVRNDLISEKDFVNLKIEEMANLHDAMKLKQEISGLLTVEYLEWYSETLDIFRKFKQP